ncbi:MAG TPA: hypothetical protein DEA96_16910, partial [Leptospiraceae bacterium]|nr:hypothetical protein [Leptospiraceae bacterium]
YRAEQFPVESINGVEQTTLIGPGSPFEMQSPVEVFRRKYSGGSLEIDLDVGQVMAMYALEGNFEFQDVQTPDGQKAMLGKGDTFVWQPEPAPGETVSGSDQDSQRSTESNEPTQTLRLNSAGPAELFIVQMPVDPGYPLYTSRFQAASVR